MWFVVHTGKVPLCVAFVGVCLPLHTVTHIELLNLNSCTAATGTESGSDEKMVP